MILAWQIRISETARKELACLDRQVAKRVIAYLNDRVSLLEHPKLLGEPLKGERFNDLWRYRVGDWRIICHIEDRLVTVLVLHIGNRSDIYKH